MQKENVKLELIAFFYNTMIPSLLIFGCCAFYGLLNKALQNDLERAHIICKMLLSRQCQLQSLDLQEKHALISH